MGKRGESNIPKMIEIIAIAIAFIFILLIFGKLVCQFGGRLPLIC